MKKLLTLSLLCVLSTTSLGLIASCGQQRPDTPTIPEEKQFIVTLEGEKQQGQVLTVVVKDESNNALNGSKITVTEGDNLITLNGNQLTLNEIGHVKIEVSLQGYKTQTFEFNITEAPLKKLNVEYEGKFFHGETITVLPKTESGEVITDFKIDIVKGAAWTIVRNNTIGLLDAGEVAGTISKEGYEDTPFSFTAKSVERLKDIKNDIDKYNGKVVTTRGVVTASYGNTFYLMDGKTGFYVYNMNTLETTGDPGDGFVDGRVVMNQAVIVTAKVDNGSFGLQLTGYSDKQFISEACVLKSNMTPTDPVYYNITNEGELESLNAQPKLAGSRVKITGKYIRGDFSSVEQTSAKDAIFSFAYGDTQYEAKFNKKGSLSTVKKYWNKENIEVGDYVTIEGNFTHYNSKITIDLADEGTTVHNESKDKTNIICSSSADSVEVSKTIKLSATLPEGMEGTPTYEIIKGKDNATLEGDVLTGTKAGQVVIVAKLNGKTSMPIEIIVKEGSFSSVSSIRDMEIGAQVTAVGKVLTYLKNGLVIQDETGYLYCTADDDFYPHGIKIGDTVKVTGTRNTYNTKKPVESISDSVFEVITPKTINTEYQKIKQSDFKNFTKEELKYGKAVEVDLVVDKMYTTSGTYNGRGLFVADANDEPGTEYYFYGWGSDKFLKKLTTTRVQAIVYQTYNTAIGKTGYILMVVTAKEIVIAPESINLTLEKDTIDNHVTFGSSMTYADITVGPEGASANDIKLVAVEGADLVEISSDFFHAFKIKAISKTGKVKLQAQTSDGSVKSNIVELTITLYVEQ